jgi:hypothetical protein
VTPTDVLERAWKRPFTTKSDFARENATLVAVCASDGHITTKHAAGLYGTVWQLTPAGLKHLWIMKGVESE